MRILNNQFRLIFSTLLVVFLHLPQSVRADGGEDYYKELRKLKTNDPAAVKKIRESTIDAELIKKANAESRANASHNAEVMAKTKKGKAIPSDLKAMYPPPATGPNGEKAGPPHYLDNVPVKSASKKGSSGKTEGVPPPSPSKKETAKKESSAPSGPIQVNHETPDELSFPGTNDEEPEKK